MSNTITVTIDGNTWTGPKLTWDSYQETIIRGLEGGKLYYYDGVERDVHEVIDFLPEDFNDKPHHYGVESPDLDVSLVLSPKLHDGVPKVAIAYEPLTAPVLFSVSEWLNHEDAIIAMMFDAKTQTNYELQDTLALWRSNLNA